MKRILSLIATILLLTISIMGTGISTYADDWEGELRIEVYHETAECGNATESDSNLCINETHIFKAKIFDENNDDVSNQYTVSWRADYYHGDVAEYVQISPNGNICEVNCTKETLEGNILLFGEIIEDGAYRGIGYTEFKIAAENSISNETSEEVKTDEKAVTETVAPVESSAAEVIETTEECTKEEVQHETVEKENETKSGSTAIIVGICAVAVLICSAAVLVKKK